MKTLAIILASGFSKRMKQNKLLLKYQEKTFLQLIIDKLLSLDFERIILVVSNKEIYKNYEKYASKLFVVFNNIPQNGISESIKLAISYNNNILEKKYTVIENYMFFVADQPLITKNTILKIKNEAEINKNKIIVPRFNNIFFNPVVFPKFFTDDLLKLEGDVGGKQIISKNFNKIHFLDLYSADELIDIDTIQEYNNLKNLEK